MLECTTRSRINLQYKMKNLLIFVADVATVMFGYSIYQVYQHGYQPPYHPTVTEEEVARVQEEARQRIITIHEKE